MSNKRRTQGASHSWLWRIGGVSAPLFTGSDPDLRRYNNQRADVGARVAVFLANFGGGPADSRAFASRPRTSVSISHHLLRSRPPD